MAVLRGEVLAEGTGFAEGTQYVGRVVALVDLDGQGGKLVPHDVPDVVEQQFTFN